MKTVVVACLTVLLGVGVARAQAQDGTFSQPPTQAPAEQPPLPEQQPPAPPAQAEAPALAVDALRRAIYL
jgi:hypothetical protein